MKILIHKMFKTHAPRVIKHIKQHKQHYVFGIFGTYAVVKAILLFAGFFGLMSLTQTFAAADDGFIISEYLEGSANNKAIELYNGSLSSISLSSYRLAIYTNGSATATATLTLPSYTLLTGRTYVLANNLSIAGILALANYSGSSAVLTFNGNDVIALERVSGGTKVDVVGRIGQDPGAGGWISGSVSTTNMTLVRNASVTIGDANGADNFDPALQWTAYPIDTTTYLGSHTMTIPAPPVSVTLLTPTSGAVLSGNTLFTRTGSTTPVVSGYVFKVYNGGTEIYSSGLTTTGIYFDTGDGIYTWTVVVTDTGSNSVTGTTRGFRMDKTPPTAIFTYDPATFTTGNVLATITGFSETGVTITNNGISAYYDFTGNGSFIFEFKDLAGNTGSATAIVNRIQPYGTIEYLPATPTIGNVIATLTGLNEPVTITSIGGDTHTFISNGSFTFEFVDGFGNTGSMTATVDWIDLPPGSGTLLQSGDIVIIMVDSVNPDAFEFVSRVDIITGTKIYFSDDAWSGTTRRALEGMLRFTAPNIILAGTPLYVDLSTSYLAAHPEWTKLTWGGGGGFDLSTDGDNIFVYQGLLFDDPAPNFIFGLGFGSGRQRVNSGILSSQRSHVPTQLSLNITADQGLPYKNIKYTCMNEGMRSSGFLAAVADTGNRTGSNTIRYGPVSDCVFDTSKPQVTINTGTTQQSPTSGTSVKFIATFSEPIQTGTFDCADITLTGTIGLKTCSGITEIDSTTFEIDITVAGDGSVIAELYSGKVLDLNGNPNDDFVAVNNMVIIDNTAPILAPITLVSTPSSNTIPQYTFSTDETGTITYGGACSSLSINAALGNNTIIFNPLSEGTYNDCTITVTDLVGNISIPLSVNTFTIDLTAPLVIETIPVPTPSINTTPDYTFTTDESGGTIIYSGDCVSPTTIAVSGANTITFNTLAEGTYNSCTILVIDNVGNTGALNISSFTIDLTAPILSEVTPVPTPTNDTTPNYTFSSNEIGAIDYSGDCSSSTTGAISGNNTITFNTLSTGTHTNCFIKVTDGATNESNRLHVTDFTIETIAPIISEVTPVLTPTNDTTPDYTFTTNEGGTIAYGGACSSSTTTAVSGDNTITLNSLGGGTYTTCTISVTDIAGNISNILLLTPFTIIVPSGGGGGGGGFITRDYCPNGDFSPSYYDGLCNQTTIIPTPPTHSAAPACDISDSPFSQEITSAFQRGYSIGITTLCPITDARLNGYIPRKEMAKMITIFATKILGMKPDITKEDCKEFADITKLNAETKSYISLSCQLGIMGYAADGQTIKKNFDPNYLLNRAQFGTILSRLIYGNTYNIPKGEITNLQWYEKHHLALQRDGIMTLITTPFKKELRSRVILMLERTDNYLSENK